MLMLICLCAYAYALTLMRLRLCAYAYALMLMHLCLCASKNSIRQISGLVHSYVSAYAYAYIADVRTSLNLIIIESIPYLDSLVVPHLLLTSSSL